MRGHQYPCCEHCEDDQPHIEADTHDLPCDINGCQVMTREDMDDELDRLRAEVLTLKAELDRRANAVALMRPVIEAAERWENDVPDCAVHQRTSEWPLHIRASEWALHKVMFTYRAAVAALDAGEPGAPT